MPLAILLLTRPARVVRLVTLAGLAALGSAALALGGHPLAPLGTVLALLATGAVLGVLAPLYGRAAAAGLWTARAGVALGAAAALFPGWDPAVVVRVLAAIAVVAGLRLVARRARGVADLPSWTTAMVGAGTVATILAPSFGGALALALAWFSVAVVVHATSAAQTAAAPARA